MKLNTSVKMGFWVRMSSELYGEDRFEYDTLVEAQEGLQRLMDNASNPYDGVERDFELIVSTARLEEE